MTTNTPTAATSAAVTRGWKRPNMQTTKCRHAAGRPGSQHSAGARDSGTCARATKEQEGVGAGQSEQNARSTSTSVAIEKRHSTTSQTAEGRELRPVTTRALVNLSDSVRTPRRESMISVPGDGKVCSHASSSLSQRADARGCMLVGGSNGFLKQELLGWGWCQWLSGSITFQHQDLAGDAL